MVFKKSKTNSVDLEPRKCPACGKDCVPRNGINGPFMGCPDFPKCPGKVEKLNPNLIANKLRWTFEFIARIGGIEEADKWLRLARDSVIAIDNQQPKKENEEGTKSSDPSI